jgi:secreted trypsin-like serine protease
MAVAAVSAGVHRHDVDVERYRERGRRIEFESVGRYAESRTVDDYAAGVLIAPTWVLTAAHFPGERGVWQFGREVYESKRIVRHPQLVAGAREQQWTGWDLALVELDRPVTTVRFAIRYRGEAEVGKLVTKIGYGYQGDGVNGLKSPPVAERLGGDNVIDAAGGTFEGRTFSRDVLVLDFDSPLSAESNRFGSAIPVALEIGGAKGDSGGGVFAQEAGQWQLIGIVSGGLNREIRYGSVAALARVSAANPWIDSVISGVPPAR